MTVRVCAVEQCQARIDVRGFCRTHYGRWRAHGDPLIIKQRANGVSAAWLRANIADVVDFSDACLDWPFPVHTRKGYPRIFSNGRLVHCSHIALEMSGFPRPAPPNDRALHSCDRPICVNPRHLRWGSNFDNMADAVARGRLVSGERSPGARLTAEQVREIRRLADAGVLQRQLAERFGVSAMTISRAVRGKSWTEVAR